MKLRHSARTDVGKTRDHNEDNFGVGADEYVEQMGELLVVCDGMGGHAAGEVASQIAVETILGVYYADASEDRPHVLEQAFERANADIYLRGQGSMGTTGVAALLHHDALHIANVGDSRAYLVRDGAIRQLSRDHSFVSDQVAAGLITADQARLSPHRNVITRALGYQPEVTVDLFRLPLQIGDIVVLSSDGMHGLVFDEEILTFTTSLPPDQAAQRLIDTANSRGGTDNITVVVVQVEALDWYSPETIANAEADEHDRTTARLPITAPQPAIAAPVPLEATAPPTTAPHPAAAALPAERRLGMLGGLLAATLLVVLIGIIVFALNTTPALAPGTTTTPGAPEPTLQATTAGTTAAPPAATTATTAAPASSPTAGAAPTIQPDRTGTAAP